MKLNPISCHELALAATAALLPALVGCGNASSDLSSYGSETHEQASDALHRGVATHFDGLGTPYGGCGVPQEVLESQNFVALNVQNTPGDYGPGLPRPLTDTSKIGTWNNGLNCGRWVQVTISDYCTSPNDGLPGKGFCKGGTWVKDQYNGATLNLLVADSCQDPNGWCRDDPYHLDLSTASLDSFAIDGQVVPGLKDHWNNRRIQWRFIEAPDYSGDIRIGFHQDAKLGWPAIIIAHLQNGISGVRADVNGTWEDAKMLGDNAQAYQLPNVKPPYRIKVLDLDGQEINGGAVYAFNFPSSCGARCSSAFTEVSYERR